MTGFPDGKFDILVIDPPWDAKKSNTHKARPNQTREMGYQLMDMDGIFDQVGNILEDHACDKHNVFMWCIDRTLVEAEDRMSKMGYKVYARIVWDKERGMSPCYTVRFTHEYLVWFFKPGHMVKPCKDSRGVFSDVLRARLENTAGNQKNHTRCWM